ncbi:MAG: hypothetical protein HC897_03770 [Thermoanaerobaculia bacterium]|nr:hypothetical protein [Thermoanaerobaculia bacterium]
MPDCHQSTRSTPATPTAPPRAEAPAIRERKPGQQPAGPAIRPRFSIRLAERGGVECSICGELTGSGPVGCSDDEPICDRCLIEGCHELGMVLALVAVTRGVARLEPPTEQQAREALDQLGNFAKLYEQIAARLGPPRPFRIPGMDEPAH